MGKKLRKKKRNRRRSRDCEKTKLADHLSIHDDAVESNTEQKHDYISSLPDEMLSESNTEQKHDYISSLPDEVLSESNTEQQHDYISSLPDEMLSHIISFLPFKFALTTSILSTRWRNFWSTDCVDQSDEKSMARHGSIENFCTVLTEFLEIYLELELHRPQTLRFRFSQSKIILVTIEKDNELSLDFSKGQQEMTSHFNWYLNLDFRLCPTTINMLHTVKTLHLRSVSHLTKVMISTLIKNCHQLESLIISGCRGLGALHIDDKHRLQSLKVVDCPELQILQVYAYSLKSFEFRGLLPWFFMNHVPYLIDCLLDFKNGPAYSPFSCENVLSLLLALKDAKILTLSGWFFEVPIPRWLPSAGTIFERDDFHFYLLKELSWIDSSMNSYKMDAMVSFLKICPSLEKISIHIDPMCYHVPSSLSWWAKQERCFWKDYTNRVAPNVRLNQLKFVKLTGYTDEVEIISIIDRLLTDISGVYEPMIITTSSEKGTRRVVKKPLNQPSQQWKGCQGRTEQQNQQVNYFYEFVEDEGSVLSDFVDEGFLKEFMDLLSFQ